MDRPYFNPAEYRSCIFPLSFHVLLDLMMSYWSTEHLLAHLKQIGSNFSLFHYESLLSKVYRRDTKTVSFQSIRAISQSSNSSLESEKNISVMKFSAQTGHNSDYG